MCLTQVTITNYRCINDSGPVEIGDVTCLVGKNESGKTAFLQALRMLNPVEGSVAYNDVMDYPAKGFALYKKARNKLLRGRVGGRRAGVRLGRERRGPDGAAQQRQPAVDAGVRAGDAGHRERDGLDAAEVLARAVEVEQPLGDRHLAGTGRLQLEQGDRVEPGQRDVLGELVLAPVLLQVGQLEAPQVQAEPRRPAALCGRRPSSRT